MTVILNKVNTATQTNVELWLVCLLEIAFWYGRLQYLKYSVEKLTTPEVVTESLAVLILSLNIHLAHKYVCIGLYIANVKCLVPCRGWKVAWKCSQSKCDVLFQETFWTLTSCPQVILMAESNTILSLHQLTTGHIKRRQSENSMQDDFEQV